MIHGFICECNLRTCRRRLYMTPGEFKRLAAKGHVMSQECALRERRLVVTTLNMSVSAQPRGRRVHV